MRHKKKKHLHNHWLFSNVKQITNKHVPCDLWTSVWPDPDHSTDSSFRPTHNISLVSPDGVAPSQMVIESASVNLPLHHKVQKFSSSTGSPGWSWKRAVKRLWCMCVCVTACLINNTRHTDKFLTNNISQRSPSSIITHRITGMQRNNRYDWTHYDVKELLNGGIQRWRKCINEGGCSERTSLTLTTPRVNSLAFHTRAVWP